MWLPQCYTDGWWGGRGKHRLEDVLRCTLVVSVQGEESLTHCFGRRDCWECSNPPIKSLLLGHYCYHYHLYFERRSSPWGFLSLSLSVCFFVLMEHFLRFPSCVCVSDTNGKHAQSEGKPSCQDSICWRIKAQGPFSSCSAAFDRTTQSSSADGVATVLFVAMPAALLNGWQCWSIGH